MFLVKECDIYGIIQRSVPGEGCSPKQDIGEHLQLFPWQQHVGEEGKRAHLHADDGGVLLRPDSVGGGGGAAAALL